MKNIVLQLVVLSVLFISCSDEIPSEEQNNSPAEIKALTFEKSGDVILNPGQG